MPGADGNFCPARDVETLFRPQRGACCSVVDLALNIPAEQIELPRYGFVVRPGSFHLTEQFRCMVALLSSGVAAAGIPAVQLGINLLGDFQMLLQSWQSFPRPLLQIRVLQIL